jgi:tetratricopeptide (TPR) repeat protein
MDDALPAFERAVTLAPEDFSAQFALGVSLLRREAIGGRYTGNTEAVARARVALAKAAEVNATSSEAFAWLAYAEMMVGGRLPQALSAIKRAIDLAPGRLDYVLRFADICILGDALVDARQVLIDVSHVTTDPVAVEGATQRLQALDEREARVREAAQRAAERREAREAASTPAASAAEPSNVMTIEPEPERVKREAENFKLRKVQRGEERAYGELSALECSPMQFRFFLKVGSRTIVATAKRMKDVTLTELLGSKNFTVACGKREAPETVYLTWRAAPPRTDSGATIVGQAVAVEFVPRGYTPRQ